MRMQESEVYDYARQLLEAHGDKAVAEAAQKACALEQQGQSDEAETWRHIEATLNLRRGPHGSGSRRPLGDLLCSEVSVMPTGMTRSGHVAAPRRLR
jgi:hypothetical protein